MLTPQSMSRPADPSPMYVQLPAEPEDNTTTWMSRAKREGMVGREEEGRVRSPGYSLPPWCSPGQNRGLGMWLFTLSVALAAPPLVSAADVASPGLEVWWREGELLAGATQQPGRPGVRPLVDLAPIALPSDLSGWTPMGTRCDEVPTDDGELDGLPVVAEVVGTRDDPVLQIRADYRIVATSELGRPAHICTVRLVQADELPGLELVVVWRPLDRESPLRGLTVYHVPDMAR